MTFPFLPERSISELYAHTTHEAAESIFRSSLFRLPLCQNVACLLRSEIVSLKTERT